MNRAITAALLALLVTATPVWSIYGVRICDLEKSPLPPNPIRTWGKVTSESPMMVTDGRKTIQVNGMTTATGDFVTVTGNWDGSVLTIGGYTEHYFGPAHTPMVYITAGSFLMGNNGSEPYSRQDELPQHSVYLSGYWIGKYEVTRGEYRQFINAGGYSNPGYWSSAGWNWKVSNNRTQPGRWMERTCFYHSPDNCSPASCLYAFTQTDNHPVVEVSYYEAEAFCNWAGGHLPTEAQWEKVARWTGSYPNVFPWGNTWDQQKCNNWGDSLYQGYQTSPVGSYPSGASPYGCHDMAGNVWEWCKDWYQSNYYSQTPTGGWVDPQGPSSGSSRVLRVGGWLNSDNFARCAYRLESPPSNSLNLIGFRLAR